MKKYLRPFVLIGRVFFILLLISASFGFAMFQGGIVSWAIFYSLLPFVLYDIAMLLYPLATFKITRQVSPEQVVKGDRLVVTIQCRRLIPFPLIYATVTDCIEVTKDNRLRMLHRQSPVLFIGMKRTWEWSYEIPQLQRGIYRFNAVEIEVSDFFGWIRKMKRFLIPYKMTVYPRLVNIHPPSLRSYFDRGMTVLPHALMKDTTMVSGVRDYQAGDRVSWIHWKSFARTQTLMTKEFEDRQSEEITIVLDEREGAQFEELVDLTASLFHEVYEKGSSLHFLSLGKQTTFFPHIESLEQRHFVMSYLATVQPISTSDALQFTLAERLQGSMIIVTMQPDWAMLQPLIENRSSCQSIICFVIVDQRGTSSEKLRKQMHEAATKGIHIQLLQKTDFSKALKGAAN